jgi:hypothetical protein
VAMHAGDVKRTVLVVGGHSIFQRALILEPGRDQPQPVGRPRSGNEG